MLRTGRFALALGVLAVAVSACGSGGAISAGERAIYMTAIEPKGGANVADEPFPTEALPAGGGYALKEPDADGRWEVETYVWMPSEIVVMQGDRVTLKILGVNGKSHPSVIEGYDLSFDVKRGQLTTVSFVADKAGVFRIRCDAHPPAMTANLVVLPTE